MDNHPELEMLHAYRCGTLTLAKRIQIERHVEACTACSTTLSALPEAASVVSSPPDEETQFWDPQRGRTVAIPPELLHHPRYRVSQFLGEGGMGAVFKATHQLLRREVAIKVLRSSLLESAGAHERFLREIRAAAALQHPNIVSALDAEQIGSTCFFAMEWVDGVSLADHCGE